MKYKILFFLISIFFITQVCFSQQPSDIIFPIDGEVIKSCQIEKIEGNKISYYIEDARLVVDARAFVKNGVFISLEADNLIFRTQLKHVPDSIKEYSCGKTNYLKLYKSHHRTIVMRNIGIGMTAGGLFSGAYGFHLIYSEEANPNSKGFFTQQRLSGLGLVFLGAVFTGTGIAFVIIGQVQKNKSSKKMNNCIQQNFTLTAGMTKNGIGLVFNF